jgi:beta-ketoacyl-acyl-carrier-protein synthase II
MEERIVVTGMGAISPLGLSAEESWKNAIAGVSGIFPITLFDASDFLVKYACEVKGFNPENYMPAKEARRRDRFEQFSTAAAKEAIVQAGLLESKYDLSRVGVFVSSAIGGVNTWQDATITMHKEGPRRISPFAIPMLMSNGAAGLIGIDYGFTGPCLSIASACASGADGIGIAWLLLRAGVIDVAITGASEATITQIGVGAFDRMGAMARPNPNGMDNDSTILAPQPFDRNRDGLVMGEGAAILVLERERQAIKRNCQIFAELASYASTADAYHITAPSEDGLGSAQAMLQALNNGKINPEEVDYINAHGTGTPLNDLSETRAVKLAFGKLSYQIPISSTKSMTGHMMGATGALEAIFCIQAIRDKIIPPTINYQTPDPDCDLDYVPNRAREWPVKIAMSNAFGFGGHNAVLIFREYQ